MDDEDSLPKTRKAAAHLRNLGRENARAVISEAIKRLSALL
jgi:hypothetical protein